jgi:hypothetical protein
VDYRASCSDAQLSECTKCIFDIRFDCENIKLTANQTGEPAHHATIFKSPSKRGRFTVFDSVLAFEDVRKNVVLTDLQDPTVTHEIDELERVGSVPLRACGDYDDKYVLRGS